MKKLLKKLIITSMILGVFSVAGVTYWNYKFPYGRTHRCSKAFDVELRQYATVNNGEYPNFVDGDRLLVGDYVKDSDYNLEMIVGKACDFDEALKFYKEHGYILASHSSRKFVNGVRVSHSGRAFAWDIIPLGHNGQLEDSKSREIIGVDLFSSSIPQGEWEDWLNEQNSIKWLGK